MSSSADASENDRTIAQRIHQASARLTDGEHRLARVVLDLESGLSAFAANEIAFRANVSPATAARFFKRLGYTNYAEARRQARDGPSVGSPLYEFAKSNDRDNDWQQHVETDVRNLASMGKALSPDDLRAAIDMLALAETTWILGFRNSMALARYTRGVLLHVKSDVRLLPAAGMTLAEDVASFAPGHALLALGFRRRLPAFFQALGEAHRAGVQTILITDRESAIQSGSAAVVLRCPCHGNSYFDSYAAPISLLNYLVSGVGLALGQSALERLRRIEQLHTIFDPNMKGAAPDY